MGEINGVDQISELPEPLIHHIMSFFQCPKDVARTVILSKKWTAIWASFSTIDFDQRKFLVRENAGARNDKFKKFVEKSLETKLESMSDLQKFRLYLTSFYSRLAPDLTRWLSSAINKNVKELEIHVEDKKNVGYILPQNALTARPLASLKLNGCNLDHYSETDLPNLKELSIKNTRLNLDIIQTFIQNCPLIADLRLVHCIGLDGLFISDNTKLKRVEVQECHGLNKIEVDLPNLETFLYCGKKFWVCRINLAGCQSLRYLALQGSKMTDEFFHNQLTNFPELEKLALKECNILEKIIILSVKLRELSIVRCKKLEEAIVDVPNLVSLEYAGDTFPFSSMSIASLHDVKFHFDYFRDDKSIDLKKFIIGMLNNAAWNLVASSNKNVIVFEDVIGFRLNMSDPFKFEFTISSTNLKNRVDYLLRMSRPKTICLMASPCSELLKSLREKIINREVNPNCCKYYKKKCWLHYMEDVEIVHFETGPDPCVVSNAGGVEFQKILPSAPYSDETDLVHWTTFNLKWRPNS